jgi:hypothetical protein
MAITVLPGRRSADLQAERFVGFVTAPGGPVATGTPFYNALAGSSSDSFRLTELLGDNQSRIIQLIWRVRW